MKSGSPMMLILTMGLVFIAYFAVALTAPVLPLNVHQALASVPSLKGNQDETCRPDARIGFA